MFVCFWPKAAAPGGPLSARSRQLKQIGEPFCTRSVTVKNYLPIIVWMAAMWTGALGDCVVCSLYLLPLNRCGESHGVTSGKYPVERGQSGCIATPVQLGKTKIQIAKGTRNRDLGDVQSSLQVVRLSLQR